MKKEEARERAMALFREGYNCTQAVVGCFCEKYGFAFEDAMRLSAPFGAGMGRMREVCGAVSGMFLVLGMASGPFDPKDPDAKKNVYARVQELAARFRETHGTIICREHLAGLAVSAGTKPESRTESYYKVRPCLTLIGSAAEILCEYLEGE